jgi:beta-glucosidase
MRRWLVLWGALACAMLAVVHSAAASACGDPAQRPWCNAALAPDQRAGLLLAALTQDEKLSLLAGVSSDHTGQTAAVPRVGLRSAYLTDDGVAVKQGSSTGLPIPMAIAATFDPRMATVAAGVVADEAKAKGNDFILGPTVNIMRTPLGGRTFEAYGEDPYLVSRMAVSWIEAAQQHGVIAEVKHFCCNNQEGQYSLIGEKNYSSSDLDERTLREIYLLAFEAAVKEAHAGAVMCAYNRVNYDWACENRHLLTDILKGEWGFQGMVGSDWQAYGNNTVSELRNGLDLEMPTAMTYSPTLVKAALASGVVAQAQVDDHVRRYLRTLFAAGFFDRAPYANSDAQIDRTGHAAVAQQIEEQGITLLKNAQVLPLDPARVKSIALIGPQASRFETGGGTDDVTPFTYTTPLDAIRRRAGPGTTVTYDDGSDQAHAAATARAANVAIVFASDSEGEYMDKACPSVDCTTQGRSGKQDSLIATVAAANPNTIVVLETGDPVVTPWRGSVRGLLEAWYPGEEGGAALTRVLFGDTDPGGRLPATFPPSETQFPTAGDPTAYPGATDAFYDERLDVGYRWYDARDVAPAFPFGFGLSYTSFRYDRLRVSSSPATVAFRVTNVGRRTGTDVPQLYVADPPAAGEPPRQLKGFRRVTLAPGRSTRVTLSLDARAVSHWDVARRAWTATPGCYTVLVGRSSRDIALAGTISVGGARCPTSATAAPPCVDRRRFSFALHRPRGARGRIVKVEVLVNGSRALLRRGRDIRRVTLRHLPERRFVVRIVATHADGTRVITTRTYRGCAKGRPHTRVRHGHRRR